MTGEASIFFKTLILRIKTDFTGQIPLWKSVIPHREMGISIGKFGLFRGKIGDFPAVCGPD
jgi:hypothetical protein